MNFNPEPMDIDVPTPEELEAYREVSEKLRSFKESPKVEFHNCVFLLNDGSNFDEILDKVFSKKTEEKKEEVEVQIKEEKNPFEYPAIEENKEPTFPFENPENNRRFVKDRTEIREIYKFPIIRNKFKYVGKMGIYKGKIYHWVERESKRSCYKRKP